MNKSKFLIALILAFFAFSCRIFNSTFDKRSSNGTASIIRGRQYVKGTFFTSFYDATKRSTLAYVTSNGQARILAENNPDAGMNRAFDLLTTLGLQKINDSIGASNKLNIVSNIVKLTEKSPTNIIVRDALYRLNEMYFNTLCLNCQYNKKSDTCINCSNVHNQVDSQALTSTHYSEIFKKILHVAEVTSSSGAREAEANLKQMLIADSISIMQQKIKSLTDSIAKMSTTKVK